jgi:hypothetical protein
VIQKLKIQNKIDIYDFLFRINDRYEDFYLTKNKERKFLKNNWSLIENILEKQEVYGLDSNGLKAIMIIVRDKGFRPYVKLLAENSKYTIDMLKFLKWNYFEVDLYFKLKKENPLSEQIKKTGFIKIGDRGKELLFFKKGMKQLYPITPKDEYLVDEEHRLY